MNFDEIVLKESPGLCRCCLSEGCYKDLATEYTWMSEAEVYADMLLECFDISISQLPDGPNGQNRLICEVCITRLRDACNFKKQVLDSEKKFIDMVARGEFKQYGGKVMVYHTQTKLEEVPEEEHQAEEVEVEYLDEEMEFEDDLPLRPPAKVTESEPKASVSDITVSALQVKGKRGRPKKSAVIKIEKEKPEEPKPKRPKQTTKDSRYIEVDASMHANHELMLSLLLIVENSTVMPFRWYSNNYMCFFCGIYFVDSQTLKDHVTQEHENAKLNIVSTNLEKINNIKLDVSKIACKKCPTPMNMSTLEDFVKHAIEAHDLEISKEASKCLNTFKLSDNNLSCLDCGETFRFFGPLLTHVNKYHNRMTPFLCEVCGQGFASKNRLENHFKFSHSVANFPCNRCDKKLPSANALRSHYNQLHSEASKCPKCPEVFKSLYSKKQHLALAHDVNFSQFQCDECSKIFFFKSNLVNHKLRTHLKQKTVSCEICGVKVFNKAYLTRHLVKHSNERPFECEFCKKTFQRLKTLQRHVKIHTEVKSNKCKKVVV